MNHRIESNRIESKENENDHFRFIDMYGSDDPAVAYFISITNSSKTLAIECLERSYGKIDRALDLFYERETKRQISSSTSPQQTKSKPIIIPAMIEFQRFLESFDASKNICLLENSSKMMSLAKQYAENQRPQLSQNDLEHWLIHVKVDFDRLKTLLDHDLCGPLVWIEHFQHLLQGNVCQFFDCDYMFNLQGYENQK